MKFWESTLKNSNKETFCQKNIPVGFKYLQNYKWPWTDRAFLNFYEVFRTIIYSQSTLPETSSMPVTGITHFGTRDVEAATENSRLIAAHKADETIK